jgi:hypothetical protein
LSDADPLKIAATASLWQTLAAHASKCAAHTAAVKEWDRVEKGLHDLARSNPQSPHQPKVPHPEIYASDCHRRLDGEELYAPVKDAFKAFDTAPKNIRDTCVAEVAHRAADRERRLRDLVPDSASRAAIMPDGSLRVTFSREESDSLFEPADYTAAIPPPAPLRPDQHAAEQLWPATLGKAPKVKRTANLARRRQRVEALDLQRRQASPAPRRQRRQAPASGRRRAGRRCRRRAS